MLYRLALLLLVVSIATISANDIWEGYDDSDNDWQHQGNEESITDYIAVNSEQENPLLAHFFNGSYTASDIMRELMTNRSLLPAVDRSQYRGNDNCYFSRIYGGRGGSFFRDPCSFNNLGGFIIRSGNLINSIQAVYSNNKNQQWTPMQHGGYGGNKQMIAFYDEEYVIAIVGSYGYTSRCNNCVNELGFLTENKYGLINMHGPYGRRSGSILLLAGEIGGFFGRSGSYLDAIGCYYKNN